VLRLDLQQNASYFSGLGAERKFSQEGAASLEAYLSTQPAAPGQDARVPRADGDSRRPPDLEAPATKGPPSPHPMMGGCAPQAFPKTLRLLRRAEFRRVYEEGQRRSAPLCTIFIRSNGLPNTRLGITVPRALGNAVLRNRMKRRLREVFRLHRLALPGGWDIVVNPRPATAEVPFETLAKELLRIFPKQPPGSRPEQAEGSA